MSHFILPDSDGTAETSDLECSVRWQLLKNWHWKKIPQHTYFCSSHKPLLFVANQITSYKGLPGSCETVQRKKTTEEHLVTRGSYEHYQLWMNNESVNNECKWRLKRSWTPQLRESRVYSFRCSNSSSLFHLHPVCQEMNKQRSYKETQRGGNNITRANQVISRVDRVIQGDTVSCNNINLFIRLIFVFVDVIVEFMTFLSKFSFFSHLKKKMCLIHALLHPPASSLRYVMDVGVFVFW